ncbi:hypothetical protein T459_01505 [Capsicum annuum]|uniref:Polygalacturonase n=1 Tax=Capsicum annuum TaxID=4072 RepID=A0A2G3AHH6_CAPAN|nr:hypothetical protein T459_01505 [Capsicum annuum]
MAANAFLEDPTWDENDYPMIAPLLSYGRGGDTDVGRFISLIFGTNLTDVVITGENGIIDGQGQQWWEKFHKGELKFTRPYLIEIMYSNNIQISSLTLFNSPSWNVHPIYSRSIHSDLSSKDLTGADEDSEEEQEKDVADHEEDAEDEDEDRYQGGDENEDD